jgi:hypothetical protein
MSVLYGSNVADSTLTTACDMATVSGGVETTRLSSIAGSPANSIAEITSQGIVNEAAVTSIPTTPTGRGWIYFPGAGVFAAGNWSAFIALSDTQGPYTIDGGATLRFFKYSSGVYTLIGSSNSGSFVINATRTALTIPATSLASIVFAAGDGLYIDQWVTRNGGMNSGLVNVYESSSAALGVANDMQVTTPAFTPTSGIVIVKAIGRDGLVIAKGH